MALRLGFGLALGVTVSRSAHSALRPADLPNFMRAFSELAFAIISADRWRVVIVPFSAFSCVCSCASFAAAAVSTAPMLTRRFSSHVTWVGVLTRTVLMT